LRVAVIGAGAMGSNHVRVYSEFPGTELVAIADANEAALSKVGARLYQDYRRLLAEEQIDAVSIAVPARLHYEVAMACIERGIATLIEKPIAASVSEAEELQHASELKNVVLMVGHIERFNPAVVELKRRLDEGQVGRVHKVSVRRVGPFFARERDVGVVHDLATHDIDVLRFLLGSDVERVAAETLCGVRTAHEDLLAGVLTFAGGTIASIEANWLDPVKVRELTVLGERGMFVCDYLERTLVYYPQVDDGASHGESISIQGRDAEPLRLEIEAFARAARGIDTPAITASDGIAAVRVADALVAAGRTGHTVCLATSDVMT
jgi:predicted dehydrogenase